MPSFEEENHYDSSDNDSMESLCSACEVLASTYAALGAQLCISDNQTCVVVPLKGWRKFVSLVNSFNCSCINNIELKPQSADIVSTDPGVASEIVKETVSFYDENAGESIGFKANFDPVSISDATEEVALNDFFSRPLPIATFTWAESDAINTAHTYDPWKLYFNDARVKYKLNNFAFMKANLKIKVLVNASPFYYGAMIASYQPLPTLTPTTIVADVTGGVRELIPYSQRPHLWIFPQNNEGGELSLPFFFHKNWLRIQVAQDFTDMGQLKFINYTTLKSANGVAGAGVTVQIFAWAEDVVLSGPSVGLALQSRDEYGKGIISKPASALASVASMLRTVPVIGKFATATEIGASAVSNIAKIFGFTNVPVISDAQPFRSNPYPNMASTEIGYPIEKLTLDAKNELSISPAVLGLPPDDELAISHLVQKESYIVTVDWTNTNVNNDILFTCQVTPVMFDANNSTQNVIYFTPMGQLSQLFSNWRGDVVFRFRFVASQYHKGRVRLSYDPAGYTADNLTNDANSSNVVFTQIVDLTKDTNVEFRVPYQQAVAWLRTSKTISYTNNPWQSSASPTFQHDDTLDNGTITLRVLTALTAPVAATTVNILVSVRGADNLEFSNPCALNNNFSFFAPQSKDEYMANSEMTTFGKPSSADDNRYRVNFGEAVGSLRVLFRRTNLSLVSSHVSTITNSFALFAENFFRIPLYYGYDPAGLHSAIGLNVPGSHFPYNFVNNTPLSWIAPSFVGTRGGINWTFNVVDQLSLRSIRVIRRNDVTVNNAANVTSSQAQSTESTASSFFFQKAAPTAGGVSLTSQATQSGISVICPNYTRYRMQTTNPKNSSAPQAADDSNYDCFQLESQVPNEATTSSPYCVWRYFSVAPDFNLYFYLNAPSMYLYGSVPAT
nr:MAG: capsid protein [Picornaviridae sp.]